MELSQKILQELIYERVRASVNLCQLVILEQDLGSSIDRVFESEPCAIPATREGLAWRYMEAAWRRLEREWQRLRREIVAIDGCSGESGGQGPEGGAAPGCEVPGGRGPEGGPPMCPGVECPGIECSRFAYPGGRPERC